MDLKEWLEKEGIRPAKFSRLAGVTEACLSHLLKGRRQPSDKTAMRIWVATNGQVTRNDFLLKRFPQLRSYAQAGVL